MAAIDDRSASLIRRRNLRIMLAIILIVGLGEELWVRFLPRYIEFLGGSIWVVSAYGALYNLLDAVYQYPGGWLAKNIHAARSALNVCNSDDENRAGRFSYEYGATAPFPGFDAR